MATDKQIRANRRNAAKSTGPITGEGKQRSRCNAVRHGLIAETVIGVVEDRAAYKAFERMLRSDCQPNTAYERELVGRLTSLLWRLRRATAIESGLLNIQAELIGAADLDSSGARSSTEVRTGFPPLVPMRPGPEDAACHLRGQGFRPASAKLAQTTIAQSFLRLANLDSGVFERLGRYESRLWRQVVQTTFLIDSLRRGRGSSRDGPLTDSPLPASPGRHSGLTGGGKSESF